MRIRTTGIVLAILLGTRGDLLSQSLARSWLYGFGAGTQQLYSDFEHTGYGFGVEGLAGYRFSSRLGATLAAGYGTLPFKIGLPHPTTGTLILTPFESNMFYGDLLFDYEILNQGKLHPYVALGIGGINFKNLQDGKRYNDASGILGAGLRWLIRPNMALNFRGAFHLTTGDDLDPQNGVAQGGLLPDIRNDAYFTGRIGLTFVRGFGQDSQEEELFAETALVEESDSGSGFMDTIGGLDATSGEDQPASSGSNQSGDMQEFIRLRSLKDELNQEIEAKEREISSLQSTLEERKGRLRTKEGDVGHVSAVTNSTAPAEHSEATTNWAPGSTATFSLAYQEALTSLRAKRFQDAIELFEQLTREFPTHALVSYCYYWSGEAYFGAGNHQAALEAFTKVLQYSMSLKRDNALLLMGECYVQLNRREDARETFNRLIKEHPSSEFVSKAEEHLNKI